jgi:hypothetical protein
MTPRDELKSKLRRVRQRQLRTVPVFAVAILLAVALNPVIGGIVAIVGFGMLVMAFCSIKGTVICPACGKSLGYLVTDPSYSKGAFTPLVCPADLPSIIQECPYCKLNLASEMT